MFCKFKSKNTTFKPEIDLNFRGYFEDDRHFAPCVKLVCFKGPFKYLLRSLLGKNQFAVTQRKYACIGPNLDNIG